MSVVVGFAFNSIINSPTPSPTPTVNSPSSSSGQLWQIIAPQPNRSVVGSSTSCDQIKGCIGSSSFDKLGLSIYDARTTSISITSSVSRKSLIVSGTSKFVGVSSNSELAAAERGSSTDIIIRSATTSLSAIPSSNDDATRSSVPNGENMAVTPGSSASPNLNFKSVSMAFDAGTKALTDVLAHDFTNLVEAADGFVSSVIEQTDNVIRQSKGKARAIGEKIQYINEEVKYRNERAKKRAKELRKMGHDIVCGTRKELKERTDRARRRARQLKQSVLESEVWKTCAKDQEDREDHFLCKPMGKKLEKREKGEHTKLKDDEKYARAEKENYRRPSQMHLKGFRVRRHRF